MGKICVLGAGSFGSVIAELLLNKGYEVSLWEPPLDIAESLEAARMVVFAVPAQAFREVLTKAVPHMDKNASVVNVAKGLEMGSFKRMSEVASEVMPGIHYTALSGPSHAEELALRCPTTVCVCSEEETRAEEAQKVFMTDYFRVYTNNDMVGTELGGALKNVIALGAGICDGMQLGDNAKAALMTRGMAEILRLGVAMGADPQTFLGLTGIGDLIVTCCSMHSRNRRCGILLGQGRSTEEAIEEIGQVVESITTVKAAYELAKREGVEMPITEAIYSKVYEGTDVAETLKNLMTRSAKPEY